MSTGTFVQNIEDHLRKAGLADATPVHAGPEHREHFGDAEAIFRLGPLVLRFVRDRGQEFMDVASVSTPGQFHQFDDIALDHGWTTLPEILAASTPDRLDDVLLRLKGHLAEVNRAFGETEYQTTNARLAAIAKERGGAFEKRIWSKQT